jgi:hypothetical protein
VTKTGNGSPNRDRNRKRFPHLPGGRPPRPFKAGGGIPLRTPMPTASHPANESENLEALLP